jgi:hypothetical protein
MREYLVLLLLLACLPGTIFGQSKTSTSPYSAFGVGDLVVPAGIRQVGMARTGQALSEPANLNAANPASAAEVFRFTFDYYAFYQRTRLQTETAQTRLENASLGAMNLVFKKTTPLAFTLGLNPYSGVGYNFALERTLPDDTGLTPFRSNRSGSGGLSMGHLGGAYQFFKGRLSAGAQVNYLFGSVSRQWFTQVGRLEAVGVLSDLRYQGVGYRVGLLANDSLKWIGNETIGRLGLTFEGLPNLSIRDLTRFETPQGLDTLVPNTRRRASLPNRWGIGLSIQQVGKYTLALDYLRQDWSNFGETAERGSLRAWQRVAVGAEYMPDYLAYRQIWKRLAYRAGAFYEQTYIQLQDKSIDQWGFTGGLGVPISYQTVSRLHVGVEWSQRGIRSAGLIREQNLRLFVGISFVEPWFRPRKYD